MDRLQLSAAERRRLGTIVLSVFFWGLLAHAYGFFNLTITHDSMNEFYLFHDMGYYAGNAAQWKIALGRFLFPVYAMLFRGQTVAPWFAGALAMVWLVLAVWATSHVFEIREGWLLALVSGIFTANLSVSALTASYLHDLDADMFAVLAAVCAVLVWKRGGRTSLLAIPLVLVVLGIYQSMLSVYVALVIFVCILMLADGADPKAVFLSGLRAVGLMAAAGVLYFLISKVICSVCGIELTQQENGLANMLGSGSGPITLLLDTYRSWIEVFLLQPPRINTLYNGILFLTAFGCAIQILRSRIPAVSKLLCVVLAAVLPVGMNISAFLNNGVVHLLMFYASWLMYLLILLLCRRTAKPGRHWLQALCGALVVLVLFSNARFSNTLYTRKNIEQEATLSLMTRVINRLERTEGYVPGETEVALLGAPAPVTTPGFSQTFEIVGAMLPSPITNADFYDAYFQYILQYPIHLADAERREALAEQLKSLPAFPDTNCTTWQDGTLVLKVSDS